MLEYLQSSSESIEVKYPSCGLIIAGDFNKLPIQHICRQFQLKQIVNSPTRGSSKLDLILTNLTSISASMHLRTMLNRFLIGFKSGDLA